MIWYIISGIIALYVLFGFRKIYQYDRALVFTFGKHTSTKGPGLRWIAWLFQEIRRVDMRQLVIDLPAQEVMTKDKVNLKIDGIVFYAVERPDQVILNVENIDHQLSGTATAVLKVITGDMTMSESLEKRDEIAEKLIKKLNE